ncbi:MAG: hypothetical protein IRZ17_10920 [Mycolicibacterium hassiacum]|uniref:hypothetical protein n=1 Tax=Mycolicibacterium hassiacum TaxID=46351 RepID=UPI0023F71A10|nr:hypothetical protein [Mycolicibacterium hassiacum]MBX5487113.1 hypothetical protein [Mycolicibacterium hassiacum]
MGVQDGCTPASAAGVGVVPLQLASNRSACSDGEALVVDGQVADQFGRQRIVGATGRVHPLAQLVILPTRQPA